MSSIESIGHPLVYKVDKHTISLPTIKNETGHVAIRVSAHALEGMQKEAIIEYLPTGTVWRMVSDEGPYLNGTDLAPFPLAFYTAGMAFSFMEEILRHAKARGVTIHSLKLTQHNYYTMEGSALRGDMTGGAKPVELDVEVEADTSQDVIVEIISQAEATSPPQAYMRDILENTFALYSNGRQIPVKRVKPSLKDIIDDPAPLFDDLRPLGENAYQPDIIVKHSAAEAIFNVEGGAGSSLQSEQKRILHVWGIANLRADGLKEIVVQLLKPIGSVFRIVSDDALDGGQERAPSGLAYLSAGVGFCYLTQLGRYAHIVKQPLEYYAIAQDNIFHLEDGMAKANPVDTHLFVRFSGTDGDAQQLLSMGEQTCFLHAAMRSSNPTKITINSGGQRIEL